MPVAPLLDSDMVRRDVRVRARDVVYVKGIVEASEGVASVFAEKGGELVFATHRSHASAMDQLLLDLTDEVDALVSPADVSSDAGA